MTERIKSALDIPGYGDLLSKLALDPAIQAMGQRLRDEGLIPNPLAESSGEAEARPDCSG